MVELGLKTTAYIVERKKPILNSTHPMGCNGGTSRWESNIRRQSKKEYRKRK